jgi:hypothetical protein
MPRSPVTAEHVADICRRIAQGETPKRNMELSLKEFTRQMLPHVKDFLAQGYTYKEIAEFLGHVSVADLKKAVARDTSETPPKKTERQEPAKEAPARPSGKGNPAEKKPAGGIADAKEALL